MSVGFTSRSYRGLDFVVPPWLFSGPAWECLWGCELGDVCQFIYDPVRVGIYVLCGNDWGVGGIESEPYPGFSIHEPFVHFPPAVSFFYRSGRAAISVYCDELWYMVGRSKVGSAQEVNIHVLFGPCVVDGAVSLPL
ncbi:uncharacterized protein CPUR_06905 [Claviceps purpurea 20.1]|uniref:Uncharacterized protein n=1 Tax=Claviceps purpurea (strain 20.1) TaxID=1111077 RepID=M1VXG5_CLAP2|nr:uncharacterized protein CPUR_06905 [Claviceps purpurea 20.1]